MADQHLETTALERLSYGGFFFGQNVIYIIQLQFLTYYYTEHVGISLQATTLMLLIARLWDAFNDPIMGAIVDRVSFKGGKYLPWVRFTTYAVPLSLFFVFCNFGQSYSGKLLFAYVTYILWGMLYTVSDAPIFSLSTVMTSKVFERDKLLAMGRFGAALAAISTAVFMSLKGGLGWTGAVGVYVLIAFLAMFPIQFTAKERVQYKRQHVTIGKIFAFLFRNKYLLIYYVGYLLLNATNTSQTMVAYFANSNLGNEGMVTVLLGICILPILVIAPFLPRLIQWLGKKSLNIISCVLAAALSILIYFVGYGNMPLFLALTALRTLFMQVPLLIYGMFTADCIEYGAYRTGVRTEGIAFSVQTFVTKLSGGICSTLCLGIIGAYGYVQQAAVQTASALKGIWLTLSLLPAVGLLGMAVVMGLFYHLKESDVARMMEVSRKGRIQ